MAKRRLFQKDKKMKKKDRLVSTVLDIVGLFVFGLCIFLIAYLFLKGIMN